MQEPVHCFVYGNWLYEISGPRIQNADPATQFSGAHGICGDSSDIVEVIHNHMAAVCRAFSEEIDSVSLDS